MKYCQLCQTTYIDSEIHFSFPEHINKYKKEKRSLFHQVTQGKILLEDINKLLEEKVKRKIFVQAFSQTVQPQIHLTIKLLTESNRRNKRN